MEFAIIPDMPCIYTNNVLIIFFFVDDIAVVSRKDDRASAVQFGKTLSAKYPLIVKDEIKWFLAMRIIWD